MEKLGLTTLQERRMRGNLIETFKIINPVSNYSRHYFNIFTRTGNLVSVQILKTKSINQLEFFAQLKNFGTNRPS